MACYTAAMLHVFSQLVQALRRAEIPVSPMETLDALRVIEYIGIHDPSLWRNALALSLAKSEWEKRVFHETFDRFFDQVDPSQILQSLPLDGLDRTALVDAINEQDPEVGRIAGWVVHGDTTALLRNIREQGITAAQELTSLREKRLLQRQLLHSLGVNTMRQVERDLRPNNAHLADGIGYVSQYVEDQAQAFVDLQYSIVHDATGRRRLLRAATSGELRNVPKNYHAELSLLLEEVAQRLLRKHRDRKRSHAQSSVLNVRKMIRKNMAYDGHLVELSWHRKRLRPNKIFVLCDVSGSMAAVARSFAILMQRLQTNLPTMRTFAFSNVVGEVTDQLGRAATQSAREAAIEKTLFDWGGGNTDYGTAILGFNQLVGRDLDKRSTVIILGDARSNHYNPRVSLLKHISQRSRRVIWLNPDPPDAWGSGDSEMHLYAPHCLYTQRLATLQDLRRFADRLLMLER